MITAETSALLLWIDQRPDRLIQQQLISSGGCSCFCCRCGNYDCHGLLVYIGWEINGLGILL
jgi:hypothetical protein